MREVCLVRFCRPLVLPVGAQSLKRALDWVGPGDLGSSLGLLITCSLTDLEHMTSFPHTSVFSSVNKEVGLDDL